MWRVEAATAASHAVDLASVTQQNQVLLEENAALKAAKVELEDDFLELRRARLAERDGWQRQVADLQRQVAAAKRARLG